MSNPQNNDKPSLSYKDAGVDIEAGDAFIDVIKPIAKSTQREGCIDNLGGFGAMFQIPEKYQQPVLVSGTDGVGTKLKLAFDLNRHNTIGIDLVAMCVNDILVQGAEPLFFLDYFATGKLSADVAADVVSGIGEGCRQANAALIGGETAEMPGMYNAGEYDLAGFCVGAVEREKIIDGSKTKAGDCLIGLPSSGPHSNGYSLIRKVLDDFDVSLDQELDGTTIADLVLAPTTIYVKPVLSLLETIDIHAMAHITGGGITGNLIRVLPENCHAVIEQNRWQWPAIFTLLAETANIATSEMYKTFNCGLGMILAVDPSDRDATLSRLREFGIQGIDLGNIQDGHSYQDSAGNIIASSAENRVVIV